MKTFFTLLLAALAFAATAQTQHIPYQGAAVGPQNRILKNKSVQFRLSILDGSSTGNVVYQETHSVTTDSKGLFSVSIGGGTSVVGSFSQIAWAAGAKFLQTEMDTALSGVFLSLGTTELKSVPYALYAQSAQQANSAQSALRSDSSNYAYAANSAQTATYAQSAIIAQNAARSDSSNYATTSQTATTAQSAITAQNAVRSDSSNFANSASTAQTATSAQSAINAQTALRSDSSTFSATSQAWVRMSTAQRDALTNIPAGTVIFNTTTGCPNYFNGSSWYQQCGSCSPEPSVANAGPDVLNSTATSIALQASNPSVGTGTWSILFGSGGNLTNANSPNATFTGVAGTIYTLRFTVSNACGSTFDEMNVSFTSGGGSGCSPQPSVANAGPDAFNQCGTTTLNATNPSVGTGTWSKISGNGGSFSNTASPTATFTGTAGETYTLRWTVSNGCGSTADEVMVSFVAPPTTANAGLDQLNVTTPAAVLNATAPTQGSGIWTVVAGVGGSLSGASSPNATFTGTPGQSYTLRWTVTNACGSSSSDEMTVVFGATGGTPCTPLPTTANAGPDSGAFCPGSLLYANSAYVGTGQWTVLSGSSFYFSDIATHNSAFYGSSGQTYTLRWTITTACGLSFDDVVVTVPGTVNTANADPLQANIITIDTTYLLKANAANAGSVGTWSVIGGVAGTFTNINSPTATYRGFNNTFSTLKWTISNACGVQSSDTVRLEFRLSTACNGVSSITDSRDGQVYPIVGIGTQCWMAKNLNVGTMIPTANGDQTNNQVIEKYCFSDQLTYCTTYGGLYQWAEAVQYQNGASNLTSPTPTFTGNVRGICPTGWHLPSDAEWTTLTNALGGSSVAGMALKTVNNGSGNNSSGFNALQGGSRGIGGSFNLIGSYSFFWSSFEFSSTQALNRYIDYNNSGVYRDPNSKFGGFSARCIRD
jgi:uncharacterized protein (TIGR02145 family)